MGQGLMTTHDAPTPGRIPRAKGHTLFFATPLEPEMAKRAADLRLDVSRKQGLRGTPVEADRLHVAAFGLLGFRGPPPIYALELGKQIGSRVEVGEFTCSFDRLQTWRRKDGHLLVLTSGDGVEGYRRLNRALQLATCEALDLEARPQPITPHISLMYCDRPVAERPVDPFTWLVQSFTLVHSLVGLSRHDHLQTWHLGKGPPAV